MTSLKKIFLPFILIIFSLQGMEEKIKEEPKRFNKVLIFGRDLDYITVDVPLLVCSRLLLDALNDQKSNARKPNPYYNHNVISTNLEAGQLALLQDILSSKDWHMSEQAKHLVRQFEIRPWFDYLKVENKEGGVKIAQEQEISRSIPLHKRILQFLHANNQASDLNKIIKKPKFITAQPNLCELSSYNNSADIKKKAKIPKKYTLKNYKRLILSAVKNDNLELLRELVKPVSQSQLAVYDFNGIRVRFDSEKMKLLQTRLLWLVVRMGKNKMVKYVVEEAKFDLAGCDKIFKGAVSYNVNLQLLTYLVAYCNADPRHSIDGSNALHEAVKNGHYEIMEYLIKDCGLSPESKTDSMQDCACYSSFCCHNMDCLCYAALYCQNTERYEKVIKYLIEICRMDSNSKSGEGYTALRYILTNLHVREDSLLINYLLDHGADCLIKDVYGGSILHSATQLFCFCKFSHKGYALVIQRYYESLK